MSYQTPHQVIQDLPVPAVEIKPYECPACANGEGHTEEETELCPRMDWCPLCDRRKASRQALFCETCNSYANSPLHRARVSGSGLDEMREMVNPPVPDWKLMR